MLKNGISQALARFCSSHQKVDEELSSVLQKIGNERREDKALASLEEDRIGLSKIGIEIKEGRVRKTPWPVPPMSAKPRGASA
ncbi:hypothetical protein THIX_60979 [Thiomonas sp. X19]|nr:hypothetical protein THIX_60979 [Thiomonas sp. X19]